ATAAVSSLSLHDALPILPFVSQEVEALFFADGTAHCAPELVEAQGIETRSREQVLGIQIVVAEEFVGRAMHVVRPGFGDRVHHRTEVASRVCRVWTIHHAELLHPILRRADALHPGDAGGVINSIQGEERSVALANAPKTELQNRLRKR